MIGRPQDVAQWLQIRMKLNQPPSMIPAWLVSSTAWCSKSRHLMVLLAKDWYGASLGMHYLVHPARCVPLAAQPSGII